MKPFSAGDWICRDENRMREFCPTYINVLFSNILGEMICPVSCTSLIFHMYLNFYLQKQKASQVSFTKLYTYIFTCIYIHTYMLYMYKHIYTYIYIFVYTFMRYPTTNLSTHIKKKNVLLRHWTGSSSVCHFFKPRRRWPVRRFQQLGTPGSNRVVWQMFLVSLENRKRIDIAKTYENRLNPKKRN